LIWQKSFKIFERWAINNGYQDNLSIDRIDNDGNYTRENCQWISWIENNRKSPYRTRREKMACQNNSHFGVMGSAGDGGATAYQGFSVDATSRILL